MTNTILARRERVFLALAGVFLCAMTMLNILGITRFVQLGPWALAVGVLPYPLTFLCTDLISEPLWEKTRQLSRHCWPRTQLFHPWLYLAWPGHACRHVPAPRQFLSLAEPVPLPNGDEAMGQIELFSLLYATTSGAVFASMMAYLAAQYCDVALFHFWKRLTKGKHLCFAITPAQLSVRASIRSWSWLSHLARNSSPEP